MRSYIAVAMLAALMTPLLARQSDAPRFAVVSVKPYKSPEPGGRNALVPGAYEGIGVTVRRVIGLAYAPLPVSLVDGGPGWLSTDRFEIRAKFDGNPPREQLQQMMRALLADRFKLRTHMETRPTPIFALAVERAGVLGPSLQPAQVDCASRPANNGPNVPWCAFQYTAGLLRGRGVTLDQIAGEIDAGRMSSIAPDWPAATTSSCGGHRIRTRRRRPMRRPASSPRCGSSSDFVSSRTRCRWNTW